MASTSVGLTNLSANIFLHKNHVCIWAHTEFPFLSLSYGIQYRQQLMQRWLKEHGSIYGSRHQEHCLGHPNPRLQWMNSIPGSTPRLQLPAHIHSGRQQATVEAVGFLPHTWRFGLALAWCSLSCYRHLGHELAERRTFPQPPTCQIYKYF